VPRRRIPTGRLRRRLTIAFVLVAGISAGALAAGSYVLVREARLRDSLERAQSEARFDLSLARAVDLVPGGPGAPLNVQPLLKSYENKGVHAVIVAPGQHAASNPRFDPPIPGDLGRLVQQGQLAYRRVGSGRDHLLLIGGPVTGTQAQIYFVFSEGRIAADLGVLRNVLVVGWVAVVLVAALVGRTLARRTLEPVGRASEAARSMAEGLLATRLPVEGHDEFGAWAASFNEMADALEAKIQALSEAQARERRFTSDVAHELRTPLAALVGEASLLRDRLDSIPEDSRRPAELMIQDVGRLRRLVDELMEISRLDAGRESVLPETVDLPALIGAVVRARGWDGMVSVSGGPLTLWTDRRRLERVMANLVGNAVEHGRRDVRVDVAQLDSLVMVEVSDHGPGIPSEHLPHLFERFYKADPSRTAPGSGLGLAIALENARLLGGDIEVWSETGRGARFRLSLPVTRSLPPGEEGVSSGAESQVQRSLDRKDER
jgi:signal transduction histidine kinase